MLVYVDGSFLICLWFWNSYASCTGGESCKRKNRTKVNAPH